MKRVALFLFVLFSFEQVHSQETIPTQQLILGVTGVGSSEQVTHYISAVNKVWERSGSTFVISSDQGIYNNSLITTGNADFSAPGAWPGFNFKWLGTGIKWGLGFYKVTNSKQTDKHFYLDTRDSDFGNAVYTPDFFVHFNHNNGNGFYEYTNSGILVNWTGISNGNIVRVWNIHNQLPNTSGLQNYWSNALVGIPSSNNVSPRIAWGPYPSFTATGYKIYRSINFFGGGPGTFYLIQTINSGSVYEFTDPNLGLGSGAKVYYKVKAFNSSQTSSFTNTVGFDISSDFLPKNGERDETSYRFDYTLSQNFPNPFNPSTVVKFELPTKNEVLLEIYDLMGQKIATLLKNEEKESGSHVVMWDGKDQQGRNAPSGVYFYRLRLDEIVLTKKMTLIR